MQFFLCNKSSLTLFRLRYAALILTTKSNDLIILVFEVIYFQQNRADKSLGTLTCAIS